MVSKEQTLVKKVEKEIDSAILMFNDISHVNKCKSKIVNLMEQYAEAKVLEALENNKDE